MCLRELLRLVTRESTRFDNKDSAPKAQIKLLKFPEENLIFSKVNIIVKSILSFSIYPNENKRFLRRIAEPQSGRIQK